jgi:F420-dependent oxidoreductase-like protein
MTRKLRFGVQTAPQNTTWADLRAVWKLIDEAGYDTAWLFDHFYPILADPAGPCFEGWTALAALAAETKNVEAGVLVTGNTYRHPAVLAKMGATVDHIIAGRLIMGIGAGWFELEHKAYGTPFYTTGERIRRLDEAVAIIKSMWTVEKTTIQGRYYQVSEARCEPKPVRKPHPPFMIGGAGEKLTLRVVAKHADIWNTFGSAAVFRSKIAVLQEHCNSVGRNVDKIEISWAGLAAVCDSAAERDAMLAPLAKAWGQSIEQMAEASLVGSTDEVLRRLEEFQKAGVTHFIMLIAPPFKHDQLCRFADTIVDKFR